jgi:carbon starvation protein
MTSLLWLLAALVGAAGWAVLALARGESVSAGVAHRRRRLHLPHRLPLLRPLPRLTASPASTTAAPPPPSASPTAATTSPPRKWVLFGHHFAAIAGAGPLVGPVLAAQFGYLPGTIWIVASAWWSPAPSRTTSSSSPPCAATGSPSAGWRKDEIGPVTGLLAMVAILAIMLILLAVLALVVVTRSLAESPWGVFTILCTVPIAILMGFWMKRVAARSARWRRRSSASCSS